MKTLYEFILESRGEILEEKVLNKGLKIDYADGFGKLLNEANKFDYETKLKDDLTEMAKKWYEENPRKRAYSGKVTLDVIATKDRTKIASKTYAEVLDICKDAGMSWPWKDTEHSLIDAQATMSCDHKTKIGNAKFHPYISTSFGAKLKEEYGNGYNNLPGELSTEWRERVFECVDSCDLVETGWKSDDHREMRITWTYVPKFNESKLKKVLKELQNDQELAKYADRLETTGRGIRAYYDEKSANGDHYTGD